MTRNRYPVCVPGKYVGDKNLNGHVELTIDWTKLVNGLAWKAAHNKTKRSALGKYGIKAKFIQSKEG